MSAPSNALAAALAAVALVASACDDAGTATATPTSVVANVVDGSERPAATAVADLALTVTNADGQPIPGVTLELVATSGGGALTTTRVTTDADGVAPVTWVLGPAPVANTLAISVDGGLNDMLTVLARVDDPPTPEDFGGVHAYMTANGLAGSTEDLSFGPDGNMILGIPGGLLQVTPAGVVSQVALTGDALDTPLGVAHDAQGRLWVADSGGDALRRVSTTGVVSTIVTEDADGPLGAPNHVAVAPDDAVYFTDPCNGRLHRVDAATGAIVGTITMDLPTQGGPNGVAIAADGDLWFTTESTALLCSHPDVGLTDPIAGLYRTRWSEGAFETPVAVAPGVGLFGDGLAFDAQGNLYVIFDTESELMLDESILYVLPAGTTELRRFFALDENVLANPVFGSDAFGTETLYLTLLAIAPFTPESSRGVVRVPVGIPGRPLPAR